MPAPGSRAETFSLIAAAFCLVGGLLAFVTARDSAPLSGDSAVISSPFGAQR